jgi:hypothetical protein
MIATHHEDLRRCDASAAARGLAVPPPEATVARAEGRSKQNADTTPKLGFLPGIRSQHGVALTLAPSAGQRSVGASNLGLVSVFFHAR